MYVAVKGGEAAIDNAHQLLDCDRRGNPDVAELSLEQIQQQLSLAVDRVMTEGSVYDPELAALAIKQARGDLVEAIFLLRAYRTTLPRLAVTEPVETAEMLVARRISGTFKDVPGGQLLGPTFDYTHRLLDFALAAEGREAPELPVGDAQALPDRVPQVMDVLNREDLIERNPSDDPDREIGDQEIGDLTRQPLDFPADRPLRLQNLARADEGFLLALGYSTQRGYGRNHPFAGEIRSGSVSVEIIPEELGFPIDIGEVTLTECQMVNQFKGGEDQKARFTRGYGLSFGFSERKAMAMALVDRALRARELGELDAGQTDSPAQDEEFVLYHSDNVEASGFVQHLKLPHYVDFQGELELLRKIRREQDAASKPAADGLSEPGSAPNPETQQEVSV
ncbi:MAG: carbon-phosphorus lyase complex subunit PhnI [Gammaproteobacteria bacterium]